MNFVDRRLLGALAAAVSCAAAAAVALFWRQRQRGQAHELDLAALSAELSSKGYFVRDGFVGSTFAKKLAAEVRELRAGGHMAPGKLQHGVVVGTDTATRGDLIKFFTVDEPASPALSGYFVLMDDIREALNADGEVIQTVRGELERSKFMCACYPGNGTGYVRHRDAWPQRPGRKLTLILYLNEKWQPADGGCLQLWPEASTAGLPQPEHLIIEPRMDRLVGFCSWLEHEVQHAHAERLAITTWFFNEKDAVLEIIADQMKRGRAMRSVS